MKKTRELSQPKNKERKQQCLIVLGMHRSGTSAVTGLLNLLGANIGEEIMLPANENPKGFFENVKVININEKILQSLDMKWFSSFGPKTAQMEHHNLEHFKKIIKHFIQHEFKNEEVFAIKDPRMCLLLPIWQSVFEELKITTKYVITLRNPLEISASLEKRNKLPMMQSFMLWLHYMVQAEFYTRNKDRIFIDYNDLLQNPFKTANNISTLLNIFSLEDITNNFYSINNFINATLKHHSKSDECLKKLGLMPYYQEFYSIQKILTEGRDSNKLHAMIDEISKKHYHHILSFEAIQNNLQPQAQFFFDLGEGFSEINSIRKFIPLLKQETISIDLSSYKNLKNLRIDPLDDVCIIKVLKIELITQDGNIYNDFAYTSNATYEEDGKLFFDTNDPNIVLNGISNSDLHFKELEVTIDYISNSTTALNIINEKNRQRHQEQLQIISKKEELIAQQHLEIQEYNQQVENLKNSLSIKEQVIEVFKDSTILNEEILRNKELLIQKKEEIIRLKEHDSNLLKENLTHANQEKLHFVALFEQKEKENQHLKQEVEELKQLHAIYQQLKVSHSEELAVLHRKLEFKKKQVRSFQQSPKEKIL